MNYVPNTVDQQEQILTRIGVGSLEELFADIPESVRRQAQLKIREGLSELELVKYMGRLAAENKTVEEYTSYLGAGAYEHFIPSYVDQLLLRSEFYTAYTPYQPEISQGTLQAIYEFQTLVCELTGMDGANASMYDGASALAEAALMSCDATRRKKVLVPQTIHPEYREVLRTYLLPRGVEILEIPYQEGAVDSEALEKALNTEVAAVLIQSPNFFGMIEKAVEIGQMAHAKGGLLVMAVNPVSLGLLKSPGELGADIVVGEGQPFGNPLNFGGPYLGFLACREKYVRRMPGRIVGATKDKNGKKGYVLTLQAREQHIRREKAASNICSNEALCALAFTIHLSGLGKRGLKEMARLNLQKAHYGAEEIGKLPGMSLAFQGPFFHEFVIKTEVSPRKINEALLSHKIIGGLELSRFYPELDQHLLFCVTETKTKEDIDRLVAGMGEIK
ncbi:Glycine dehydrogenase (decarboxylating) [Desulfitobacterium hafniense DCB-2]|uniref:Probable glycine dehydrogenase (decarboxylating) subunit 1 n=2 Tax=Desulfitobacterium hafniense TaxID=49338 RepID=GCSPA_DESHD|nr:aminomethyl-transferring glycine dehydrogenase subunit GcvPA [Desulfitobacterium hafniense]B8FT31.1 RecName: Full=Probable glycine dehydrogenase (decarboxylating) subunit 1; AltName: Full=Glycine cleavage system P-protein subunit 1; AltName: Full=Glycine decarboxylase subunit 1; AltName: Full=Glycine dehydrogenase (aminomethyl-transferring) subunit 1 [Desulfitobacterium hafniense DCB-2]ACL22047.1 Glycine dehydrogenase (decarboxylating) [Desulfitobacterium hafniense DCB-2]EHL07362.1 glycine de